ncbi:hypothetical protein MKZ38_001308 [Zalerion maritima]|uniref:Dihydrodipicolinate synthetase n=1 Tax=Zalerion maritima TaxID=339359 RepID=A0AAD5RQI4_9PEZI|nr:hypothetical protein MKZ38_001308 [Zalerion maritima]
MVAPDIIPPPPGIYVPVPTFFKPASTSNGTSANAYSSATTPPPDLETQAAHSVYLAERGIRGLALLGSTGEAVHLTNEERKSILKACSEGLTKAGFPDYPIIAGTASNSIDEVVLQLEDAKEAGAQWGLVLAPGYFAGATRPNGVIAWYTAVADRSPIPIMIYHYPGVSNNVKLPPSVYHTLAPHPNIVGCKLSHGDASVHAQIALHPYVRANPLSFSTFTGLGQHLLPVMAVGCVGAIDGSAGFFPRTVVRLWTLAAKAEGLPSCFKTHEVVRRGSIGLWERGMSGISKDERKELRDLQYAVSSMEELVVTHGTVGIKEAISRLRKFGDVEGTRLPLMGGLPGGDVEWAKWAPVIDAVEEIETRLENNPGEKGKPALFSPTFKSDDEKAENGAPPAAK